MDQYIAKDVKTEIVYWPGKGSWTFHIKIPNTHHISGRWGYLKVSGYIDHYRIDAKNLFTIKGQDKLLSINQEIRTALNKSAGDTVTLNLYLTQPKQSISESQILETFRDSGVLAQYEKLSVEEKNKIFENVQSQISEDLQVKMLIKYIEKLERNIL